MFLYMHLVIPIVSPQVLSLLDHRIPLKNSSFSAGKNMPVQTVPLSMYTMYHITPGPSMYREIPQSTSSFQTHQVITYVKETAVVI